MTAPIESAIVDHITHEGQSVIGVTSWLVVAEYMDDDGDSCLFFGLPDGQGLSTTVGLAEIARHRAQEAERQALKDWGDD